MSTRVDSERSGFDSAGTGASEAALSLFAGGGEMGARMRSFDWSKTAVGPVETWPQSLKTAVRIMLTSRYAMWMGWGADFTFFCNDAYLPTVGVKQSWVLGASARKVWSEIWDDIGPRAEIVFKTGTATWDEGLLLFLERSGFSEETYHTFSYSPLPDDSGQVGGMLCVVTEETTRTIDERRLELLRELAAELSATHTEGQVCDAMVRILGVQPRDVPFTLTYLFDESGGSARLACATGVAPDSAASPSLISLKEQDGPWPARSIFMQGTQLVVDDLASRCGPLPRGPWDKPARQAVVMPLAQQGQGRPAGFLVLGLNPYRPYDMAYRGFVSLLAGQVSSGLANAHAYEQERRRAEALAELDRAKTTFFSNVSHEFRTPLTLLLGPLEDALGDSVASLPTVQRERLVTAHNNSLRLLKLVNTLLDFSRIEAGRLKATYEPTELGAFTAELASNFRSASERVGLKLIVDCEPLGEPVYVDRDMWEKVVLNLLSNAFKFTLKGEIRVVLRRVGECAELQVQDTGIGIAPSELPHLFERFYRVEGARGRSLEGTGIGLALAQELVKLHGGIIGVTSTVNAGSTFTVTLPLGVAHLPAERVQASGASGVAHSRDAAAYISEAMRWLPADSSANAANAAEGSLPSALFTSQPMIAARGASSDEARARILLADDNADMRDYVRRLLEPQYDVITATDGQAALHAAMEQRPDLVLTDVMMPNLDGFGLLKALRSDVRTAATPIILLSARAGEEARLEGHAAGADDYLIKPFSARELIARIGGALALARLRRQIVRREEELKAEKAMVLESIQESFIAVDASWGLTYINALAERIVKEERATLIGRSLWEIFPGLTDTGFGHLYRRSMAERVMLRTEEYYRPYACWFEVSVYPLSDGGIGIYFHDISERKRTEAIVAGQGQALELEINGASLDRVLAVLTQVVESQSGEGVQAAILLADPDGLHLRLGAAPSLPADYCRDIDSIALEASASADASAPMLMSDLQIDPRWLRFRELASEHGLCICWSTPLFSPQGKVLGIFALYHREVRSAAASDREVVDILAPTAALVLERRMEMRERLAAEVALRDNEQRYRQLVHSMPAAVYTCDKRGYITMYNDAAAALWGRRPELGKQMWGGSTRLYRPDGTILPQDEMPMVVALREGRMLSAVELVMERPDGSRRHVLTHPEPICDHSGQVTGALNIIIDITDRKHAEDALKEADRRKDEFLATLAHELRNPLAPIRSGLQLLRMSEGAAGVNTERVYGMMERQVNHLVRLVDDLLEISRITRGKIDLRLEDVNLAAVLRSAIDTSRPLIEAAEHELSVSLADESLMVRADSVRLSQVIANLLNNAAKYTLKQGHIWLTVEPVGREVRIAVRDNGVGIPADMLPRVFELFTQVDRTQKHSQGGLGIGLALVKSLIDMHQGRVDAHSAGPDRGSEFVVYLPLLRPQVQDSAEGERGANGPGSEQGAAQKVLPQLRIVVVDDSRDAADSLSMMLRLLGSEVHTAHDGPSGLKTIAQHKPDIVLLDIGMPGMDGYDVARRVRQREGLGDVVLIALTGWGQTEDRVQSKQAGFDHHLVKPVELSALQALLTSIANDLRAR